MSAPGIVQAYEQQLAADAALTLEQFLGQCSELDPDEAKLLVQFDLVLRCGRPDAKRIHQYLEIIPILADFPQFVLDLIDTEIVLRCQLGEDPKVEEYLARFPRLSADLAAMFEVHHAESTAFDEIDTDCDALGSAASGDPGGRPSGEVDVPTDDDQQNATSIMVRCRDCDAPVYLDESSLQSLHECLSCGSKFRVEQTDCATTTRLAPQVLGQCQFNSQTQRLEFHERYILAAFLGRGGFANVWRGRDISLDRDVAIKMPRVANQDEQKNQDFVDEARAAARLRHPHILTVHEVDWYLPAMRGDEPKAADKTICIVSEFLRGRTMRDQLNDTKRMSFREAARLLAVVCSALEHAHSSGVIHRDLKPENIMLLDGSPVLMDFGLARIDDQIRPAIDVEGHVVGTIKYMSPEQARGDQRNIDRRTDIFSVGMILYELLSGRVLCGASWRDWYDDLVEASYEIPNLRSLGVPTDLEAICCRCLAKSPDDRYGSARELEHELTRFLEGFPVKARPVGGMRRLFYWASREKKIAAFTGMAAAALLAVAVVSSVSFWLVSRAKERVDSANAQLRQRNQQLAETTVDLIASQESLKDSNRALTDANARILAANKEALDWLRDARDSVDTSLTGFASLLRYYPNTDKAREFVLRTAAEKYERFSEKHSQVDELELERARALMRLGRLRTELRDLTGAASALHEAEKVLSRGGEPREYELPGAQIDLAGVWTSLGYLKDLEGENESAESYYRKTQTHLEQLAPRIQQQEAWRDAAATNSLNLANLQMKVGTLRESADSLRVAIQQFDALSQTNPIEARYEEGKAVAQTLLGNVKLQLREFQQASEEIRRAVTALQRLRERAPDHPGYISRLAETRLVLIGVLHEMGRFQEEEAEYRGVMDDLQTMAKALPPHASQLELTATTRMYYGQLLHQLGDNHQAESQIASAGSVLDELAAKHPDIVRYEEENGTALILHGGILLDLGEVEPAKNDLRKAAKIFEGLAAEIQDPASRELQVVALSHLARAHAAAEEFDSARKAFSQAEKIVRELNQASQNEDRFRRTSAHLHWQFGLILHAAGDMQAALSAFQTARDDWQALSDGPSRSVIDQKDLAWFLACCPDVSLRNARQAIRLCRTAIRTSPNNLTLYTVLAAAQHRAGEYAECLATVDYIRQQQETLDDRQLFLASMAYHFQGDSDASQRDFQRGAQWMKNNRPRNPDSKLLYEEALAAQSQP